MKKTILLLAVSLTTLLSFAQDSLSIRVGKIEKDIRNMQADLRKCHRIFSVGSTISLLSPAPVVLGYLNYASKSQDIKSMQTKFSNLDQQRNNEIGIVQSEVANGSISPKQGEERTSFINIKYDASEKYLQSDIDQMQKKRTTVLVTSSVVTLVSMLVGQIIIIHSHSFIGKAGISITGNGLAYNF